MSDRKKSFLQELYRQHGLELHQFLIRRVGEQEAADLLQETWLHFLRLADLSTVRMPRAFLYKTAAHIAIDHGRKAKRSVNFTDAELDKDALPSLAATPETVTDSDWQFERFSEALQELPELRRRAFIMNKMEGLTHAEIAKRLGISEKSVQRTIIKALNHCIKRLAP
jgi:RNA polymerase sigma factor (sigma-70 family)